MTRSLLHVCTLLVGLALLAPAQCQAQPDQLVLLAQALDETAALDQMALDAARVGDPGLFDPRLIEAERRTHATLSVVLDSLDQALDALGDTLASRADQIVVQRDRIASLEQQLADALDGPVTYPADLARLTAEVKRLNTALAQTTEARDAALREVTNQTNIGNALRLQIGNLTTLNRNVTNELQATRSRLTSAEQANDALRDEVSELTDALAQAEGDYDEGYAAGREDERQSVLDVLRGLFPWL